MIGVLIVASYLVGSIPAAWLIARLVSGQDLRRMGSGNLGVMNTALSVSRWAGLLVFLAEAAKGVTAVALARRLGGGEVVLGLAVLATVVGTRWSIWLRGAGGRGNTAGMSALLIVSWLTLVSTLVVWLFLRLLTRRSFIATRITFVVWPLIFGLVMHSWQAIPLGALFSLLFVSTQRRETDDHLLIKRQWPSLTAFLTTPRRRK